MRWAIKCGFLEADVVLPPVIKVEGRSTGLSVTNDIQIQQPKQQSLQPLQLHNQPSVPSVPTTPALELQQACSTELTTAQTTAEPTAAEIEAQQHAWELLKLLETVQWQRIRIGDNG